NVARCFTHWLGGDGVVTSASAAAIVQCGSAASYQGGPGSDVAAPRTVALARTTGSKGSRRNIALALVRRIWRPATPRSWATARSRNDRWQPKWHRSINVPYRRIFTLYSIGLFLYKKQSRRFDTNDLPISDAI